VTAQPATDLDFLGVRTRILAEGLCESIDVPAGEMPPLHVHHSHDEGFYVLSGEVSLYMPGEQVTLRPRDFFLAPRGIPHVYRVSDDGPASWLVTSHPAGFEKFVAQVAALGRPDPETLTAVAAEHDIEILGPPGTMPA
jgi:mannose-6-phosphate isomerase-like protein (cupin superfamily)